MKTLMKMFSEQEVGKGVVFYETVISFKKQKHTVIECVPVPWGAFDVLPGYFKVRSSVPLSLLSSPYLLSY